jgi:hypothetical protein
MKAVPAPTKDTAGVELAGVAERVTTAKPEALEPFWVEGEAWRGLNMVAARGPLGRQACGATSLRCNTAQQTASERSRRRCKRP